MYFTYTVNTPAVFSDFDVSITSSFSSTKEYWVLSITSSLITSFVEFKCCKETMIPEKSNTSFWLNLYVSLLGF